MLQENKWTGLLFLLGLFIGNWRYGLAALLASIVGTLTARLLTYKSKEVDAGLFGFSPALVGVVLVFLFDAVWQIWLLVFLGAAIAAILQHFFIRRNFPAFTFPFILVSWMFIFLIQNFSSIQSSPLLLKEYSNYGLDYLLWGTKGYGQVIFQSSIWVGILFFLGVLISSPIAAIYGLLASFVTSFIALQLGQDQVSVNLGVFGFNAVLSAIVFAGAKSKDALWVLISIILTLMIQIILMETQVLKAFGGVLTFPFVAGTWITLLIQKILRKDELASIE